MAKSADAFRTISEVAEWLDTPAHVLRFWESKFTQVKPVKRAGGRRYYRPQDMRLLGGIKKLLHDDGMTIKGVQKLLRDSGIKHVSSLSPPLVGEEDMTLTHSPAAPEPGQVLDFRPRPEEAEPQSPTPGSTHDTGAAPETRHPAPAQPPRHAQRSFNLTHSVPKAPPRDDRPAASAARDDLPPAEDTTPVTQDTAPDTPPAQGDTDMSDIEQSPPRPEADDPAPPRPGVDTREEAAQTAPEDEAQTAPEAEPAATPLPGFLSRPPAETDSAIGDAAAASPPEDAGAAAPETGEEPAPHAPAPPDEAHQDGNGPEGDVPAEPADAPAAPPPAPVSLHVDVPDDPADDEPAAPGPLAVLADVPRPFPGFVMRAIRPLAERLRQKLDETDQG